MATAPPGGGLRPRAGAQPASPPGPDTRDAAGRPVPLGRRLAAGGEGAVYELAGRPDQCAKVYHAPALTAERRAKLEAMLSRVPRDPTAHRGHPSLAWPQELLFTGGTFCGFAMPLVPPGARTALAFLQPEDRARSYPEFHFRYLLTAGRNLASAVAALHQVGACVGDLNESNVMITPSALVTLIDCDSFQVGRHRCPVGKAEYLAPELLGRPLGQVARTPETDAFALAVLLFQLLMQGFHPFSGRWLGSGDPPDVGRRMQAGMYAYSGRPDIAPPPAAPGLTVLPRAVREAMDRAFGPGITESARRPSAREWVGLLEEAAHGLRACRLRPAQHHYPRHLRTCPWCALAERGHDYFPEAVGDQVALPAARAAAPSPAPVATAPPPRTAAAPRILVEPAHLAFAGVVRGSPARTAAVTVRNVGKADFRGRVVIDPPGAAVSVQPSELYLSPYHGENEQRVTVRIDPGKLWWGQRRSHTVRITDGDHLAGLRVVVAAAEEAVAAATVRRTAVWGAGGAACLAAAAAIAARHWGPVATVAAWLEQGIFAPGAPLRALALWAWCGVVIGCLPAVLRRGRRLWGLSLATLGAVALLPPGDAWAARAGASFWAFTLAWVPIAAVAARAIGLGLRRRLNGWVALRGAGLLTMALLAAGLAVAGPVATAAVGEAALHLPPGALQVLASVPPPVAAMGLEGLPAGVPADAVVIRLPGRGPWTATADGPATATLLPPGTRYWPGSADTPLPAHTPAALGGTWRYAVLTAPRPTEVAIAGMRLPVYPGRPVVLRHG